MSNNKNSPLIPDWKSAWRLWSVQLNAVGVILMTVVEILSASAGMVPASLMQLLPYGQVIAIVIFVLGLVARVLKQKTPE